MKPGICTEEARTLKECEKEKEKRKVIIQLTVFKSVKIKLMLNSLTVNRALSISDVKTRANQKAGYLIDAICDTSSAAVIG